jgi:hypothetical protein
MDGKIMNPSRGLIVTGAGRSGTSAVASLFRHCGLFQGNDPLASTEHNPLGYYEDRVVNSLNDELILREHFWELLLPRIFIRINLNALPPDLMSRLWIAAPRWLPRRHAPKPIQERIRVLVKDPFCLKDPRFAVTLPAWKSELPSGTRFIVAFRHPGTTRSSILKEWQSERAVPDWLPSWIERYWERTYRRLLIWSDKDKGRWRFVDYDALVDKADISSLEDFTGYRVDRATITPSLRRSRPSSPTAPALLSLYEKMQRLSQA